MYILHGDVGAACKGGKSARKKKKKKKETKLVTKRTKAKLTSGPLMTRWHLLIILPRQ